MSVLYFVQNNKWQALFALTVYMCPLFLFFSLNCEGVTPFICLNGSTEIARIRKTYFIGNLANAQIGIC